MAKTYLLIGSIFGFLGVAFGAFGAHALKASLSDYSLEIFKLGTHYQLVHCLALLFVGTLAGTRASSTLKYSGLFFTAGTIIFSGSLYILAITGIKWLGAITPIGGSMLLIGWLLMAISIIKKES